MHQQHRWGGRWLKRSGAWWYEVHSHQMLVLRCAKYNGTLDQVFARSQQRLRKVYESPTAPHPEASRYSQVQRNLFLSFIGRVWIWRY